MDRNGVVKLLAIAMSYDNRNPGQAIVDAWEDAARRQNWTYDEAAEAIKDHYAESAEFVMPGHITERIRAKRPVAGQLPTSYVQVERPPADPTHVAATVDWLRSKLGWSREVRGGHDAVLDVECPACHAAPNRPCTYRAAGSGELKPLRRSRAHPSRVETWNQMIKDREQA